LSIAAVDIDPAMKILNKNISEIQALKNFNHEPHEGKT
jgi:hypothetical protein